MPTVKINTSDMEWLERHPYGVSGPVAYGTDIKGVMYFTHLIEVEQVEHVKFAGAAMIRFDIGPDAPRDHNRYAMYPETYLVVEDVELCDCTNEELEAGRTCGLPQCPNRDA